MNTTNIHHSLVPRQVLGRSCAGLLTLALVGLLVAAPASANDARQNRLRDHVHRLASDELGGRLTGTEGARLAADYLIQELRLLDAAPIDIEGADGFRVPFDFTSGSRDTGSSIRIGEQSFAGSDSITALSFSDNGTVSGQVVFAGYGLTVPDTDELAYDSYATLDVEGKIVVALRYFPEDVDEATRNHLARYSGLRYKAMTARERGASALLLVTGPRSPKPGETIGMLFDTAVAGSGIVAASINGEIAEALFAGAPKSLADAQAALDTGNPHEVGFDLTPTVELEVSLEREQSTGYNIVAEVPTQPATEDGERPWLLLGAHYDHLGHGGGGNSLARDSERDAVHNGADDNASGTAAVLEIARGLAGRKLSHRIAVAFWSGEELGLLGSTAFAKAGPLDGAEIVAYLNFDMVGRSRDNKLSLQGTGSSPGWATVIERSNVPVGFDLSLQEDPYLPTDSAAFNAVGVPALNFFTGSHEDYHRPSDDTEKIDFPELDRVVHLGTLIARRVAEANQPLEFVKVERKAAQGGDRDTVRAYTGTIPDYATDIEGLLLGGVMAGGPAAAAGLQEGDIIVQFGEREITNIYDYTYALDAARADEPLQVIYVRDGERHETTLTPTVRP